MPILDNTTTDKRIYVACLSAYNNGHLHGAWVDASDDADAMQEDINTMLASSPVKDAEEWAIHDYEGLGKLDEYASLASIVERFELLADADDAGIPEDVAMSLLDDHGGDVEHVRSSMRDNYSGAWPTVEDYAENLWEDFGYLGEGTERIRNYIDWEAVARDLKMDLTVIKGDDGNFHIFWAH